jgi:hypothetical protein
MSVGYTHCDLNNYALEEINADAYAYAYPAIIHDVLEKFKWIIYRALERFRPRHYPQSIRNVLKSRHYP